MPTKENIFMNNIDDAENRQ